MSEGRALAGEGPGASRSAFDEGGHILDPPLYWPRAAGRGVGDASTTSAAGASAEAGSW